MRYSLLDGAGLRHFVPSINLTAAPKVLAGELIGKLEPYGILPNQPNLHALGALVNYVLSQPDTPQDDARFLAEMLVKYQLVADPEYLAKLRAEYSLDMQPVREVGPILLPPTEPPTPVAEATFSPEPFNQKALERLISTEPNFIDTDLLAGAVYSAQAVGRIERPAGNALGTGFLVGPDLILTANHVLKSKDTLHETVIRFDYQTNTDGVATQGRVFEFSPDFHVGSPPEELDFALVRLKGKPLVDHMLQPEDEGLDYMEMLRRNRHRGYLLVAPRMIVEYERIGVIHHPRGGPQKIVLTDNLVLADMTAMRVHYMNVSDVGSSGAPLLNHRWEVIAMHHSSGAHPPIKDTALAKKLQLRDRRFNEGIPMRAILPLIERYLPVSRSYRE